MDHGHGDPNLGEPFTGELGTVVSILRHDPLDPRVDDVDRTVNAGLHRAVESRALHRSSDTSGLDDGAEFRVTCSLTMLVDGPVLVGHFADQMPDFITVRELPGGPDVSGRDDLLVLIDQDGGATASVTGCPFPEAVFTLQLVDPIFVP